MDLLIGLLVFMAFMVASLALGYSMLIGLVVGLISFAAVAYHRGYTIKDIYKMCVQGVSESVVVLEVMAIIGVITAVWRCCGTIAFFVDLGVQVITPGLFILIAYTLSVLLSYALGTSFGVAATVGVIFMALARSGGVDPMLTAGAVMSGIYFGDRGAPVSSSAVLVASCTKTELIDNVKLMMKSAILPLILCFVIYGVFSFFNPIQQVDVSVLDALHQGFVLSWWEVVPAVVMLVLPFLNVSIIWSMAASIATGSVIALVLQKMPVLQFLKALVLGYKADGTLGQIINGGGLVSMLEVIGIIILSSTFSGIFAGTRMLDSVLDKIEDMIMKIGRFGTSVVISLLSVMVFCNQTIATMINKDLLLEPYINTGGSNQELAIDMENSVILISGIVPWALACSVPLTFMGASYGAMEYAFFMYLVPICYFFTKKKLFDTSRRREK
ncbi:MAG: sodium:proton antiporter [Clostridia bacterium]|nr:sodium:proton antiporter [Clostridia bacterium]